MGQRLFKAISPHEKQCVDMFRLKQITHQQTLLFDGFFRLKIFSQFQSHALMTNDVKIMCYQYYLINIDKCKAILLKDTIDEWPNDDNYEQNPQFLVARGVAEALIKGKQFFVAHKIIQSLIHSNAWVNKMTQAIHHELMAILLRGWDGKGHKDKIIFHYETAISLYANNYQRKMDFCKFLRVDVKEYDLALKRHLELARTRPNHGYLMRYIAYCYVYLDEHKNAEKYYLKALELEPNNARNQTQFSIFSVHYSDHPNIGKAIECAKKAIELDPKYWRAHLQYAIILRDYKYEYFEAEKWFLKCMELLPNDKYIGSSYAFLLYLMGRYDEAKERIEVHIRHESIYRKRDALATFFYGVIHSQFGNTEIASQAILDAVKIVQNMHIADLKSIMRHLSVFELNADYKCDISVHNRFKQLLCEKFK